MSKKETDKKLTRSQRRAEQKRQKQLQSIGIIVLGILVIASGVIIAAFATPNIEIIKPPLQDYASTNGNTIGDPNAPVIMEIYSNYACSHCRDFSEYNLQPLIAEYVKTGKVYLIYRSFNQAPNDDSGKAAQAAYCAGDQGKFWQMGDVIFANYYTGFTSPLLIDMANYIGIDTDTFKQCLNSGKYSDQIKLDWEVGLAAGITGTPSFTINGVFAIEGNREYSYFQQQIEAALESTGN